MGWKVSGIAPDGGVDKEKSDDEAEVSIVEQDDCENGSNLHSPGKRVPEVPKKDQKRNARALGQLVVAILVQPALHLS